MPNFKTYTSPIEIFTDLCTGHDLFHPETGRYIFDYNEDHDLCYYTLSEDQAENLRNRDDLSTAWSDHLGIGGTIVADEDRIPFLEEMRSSHLLGWWEDVSPITESDETESVPHDNAWITEFGKMPLQTLIQITTKKNNPDSTLYATWIGQFKSDLFTSFETLDGIQTFATNNADALVAWRPIDITPYVPQKSTPNTLEDTIPLMTSDDYLDKLKAEYYQLEIRYNALIGVIEKYKNDTDPIKQKIPIQIYESQLEAMEQYKTALKCRISI